MTEFQPNLFDKFMLWATPLVIPFWMPLVVGSLIAIFAKAILKVAPFPEDAKNTAMRIAGTVRNFAIYLVLFMFVVLFWSMNYEMRQYKAMQSQYSSPAK